MSEASFSEIVNGSFESGRLIPLRVETAPPWSTRAVDRPAAFGGDLELDQAIVDQHPLADAQVVEEVGVVDRQVDAGRRLAQRQVLALPELARPAAEISPRR